MKIIYINVTDNNCIDTKKFKQCDISFTRLSNINNTCVPVSFLTKYFFPRNYIGCSDSHHKAWKYIVDQKGISDEEYFMICEEDVIICDDKLDKINEICKNSGYSIIWTGGSGGINTFKDYYKTPCIALIT